MSADITAGAGAGSSPDYARKALIGSTLGFAMDGFDLLILGFMLPAIATDLGLSPVQSGALVTWTLIGAVLGGILFGVLSDYYGRVRVLAWTILLFAVFTGLCALAQGFWDLLAYRFVAGLGLGGEFGIGMALATEAWSAEKRARASSYVALGWQGGVLLAALVTPLLLPLIGWRGMFAVGIAPAVVAFIVRRTLGEPEIFVARAKGPRQPLPLGLLVKDWETTKTSFAMFVLCAVQNFGYYGIMIWLPNYLSQRFGYSLTKSSLWTAVTILGMAAGIWGFGQLADRIGRRPSLILYQIGAAVSLVVYSQLTDASALLIGGAVMGFFVNGMMGGYGALLSECYPTAARATAQNVLFNLGRGVGGFGPLVIGILASQYSFALTIALLSGIYVLDMVVTVFLVPGRRGEALT